MESIQKQTENSQQNNNIINKTQNLQNEENQKIIPIILDRPITSEAEEDKTSFSTPIYKETIERNYKIFLIIIFFFLMIILNITNYYFRFKWK
jgi:hypothetical protein